jgi:hypothetical protein
VTLVTMRCSGLHWDQALTSARAAVEAAVQRDVAAIFEVDPSEVKVTRLYVGSLVAEVSVAHNLQNVDDAAFADSPLSSIKNAYASVSSDPVTLLSVETADAPAPPSRGDRSWLSNCSGACIAIFAACSSVLLIAIIGALVFVLSRSRASAMRLSEAGVATLRKDRRRKSDPEATTDSADSPHTANEFDMFDSIKEVSCGSGRRVRFNIAESVFIAGRSVDREWPADNFHIPRRDLAIAALIEEGELAASEASNGDGEGPCCESFESFAANPFSVEHIREQDASELVSLPNAL